MTFHQRRKLMMVVFAAAVFASAIATSSASAIIKQLPNHGVVSYEPLRNAAAVAPNPLDIAAVNQEYNGGPVMPSNTDYMLMWSPQGLGAYPSGFVFGIARYFTDLAHDSGGHQNVDSIGPQYNDLTGARTNYDVRFGRILVDTDPYPASQCPVNSPVTNCLTDGQIQNEIESFVTRHHLPTDLTHEYFLLTPPHVESCFSSNPATGFDGCSAGIVPSNLGVYCAYHQNTATPTMVIYANMPYVADNLACQDGNNPNGLISDGEINGGLAHEHFESITDPLPNDAWTNGTGDLHGFEAADVCDTEMGTPLGTAPNGSPFNQVINGHRYWYQEMWSNYTESCLQRLTLPRNLPTARETVSARSGTDMTFDASRSSAPPSGVAEFSWQFNAVPNAETVQQTTPTITYTFPAAGAYSTGLTVFRADGLSAGTGGIVITGKNRFQPAFTVSQARGGKGADGRTVQFSALTKVSGLPVINYMWEFGDGKTGSGPTPTHTYRRPGTYTVTAVLFSGVGSAFPGAGAGPVYQQKVTAR